MDLHKLYFVTKYHRKRWQKKWLDIKAKEQYWRGDILIVDPHTMKAYQKALGVKIGSR
jgi:hypothetical protein